MYIGPIAKRYAKALLAYAIECKAEAEVYEQAFSLCRTLMQVKELQRAMLNPVLDRTAKVDLLRTASGGAFHPVCERFIGLLFQQRRERYLLFILASFISLYRREKEIYVGQLTTAVPLDKATEEHLRAMVAQAVKGSVEFDLSVDEEILGGFILQLDNQRMDASVKGQLRQLRAELMR